jgi:hypothetical protein
VVTNNTISCRSDVVRDHFPVGLKPGLGCRQYFVGPDIEKGWIDPAAVWVSGHAAPDDG